jgi:hypothetical protein
MQIVENSNMKTKCQIINKYNTKRLPSLIRRVDRCIALGVVRAIGVVGTAEV